jgi:S-DNA-T family DNA segregation ATPase FtsK/SpoIIIE
MCPVKGDDGRPYGGKSAKSRFFMAARTLHNQGRAVNVILWQGTQDPTDENLPKIVREGAHIRMSLVVGTATQGVMALGEAAVNGGAAPHLLRQDIDKGVVVMHGGVELPRGETSVTVRTHFIDTPAAHRVAQAAIERRRKAGKLAPVIDTSTDVVDPLADIHVAMRGEKRVRTVVVLGRLIEDVNPAVYEPWGHDNLAAAVREYTHLGLDIRKYGGDSVLRLEEVERALELRD